MELINALTSQLMGVKVFILKVRLSDCKCILHDNFIIRKK